MARRPERPTGATYAARGRRHRRGGRGRRADPRAWSASTARPEVLAGIGGFAGQFALDPGRYREPVLVSSTDGVGTKVLVAKAAGRYDTIGIDLVAMCVDDLVCTGAEPLFLLDYLAVGKLVPERVETVVSGVAEGCRQAGCALLGGETAEHPGAMGPDEFDLAGFAVGVVERDERLGPERVRVGDALVGLASPGLRSNGYTLARHVCFERAGRGLDDPAWDGADRSVADELLRPSVIYAPAILAALGVAPGAVHACAHITGGGIAGNVPRLLPARRRRRARARGLGDAPGLRRDGPPRRRGRRRDGPGVQPRPRHGRGRGPGLGRRRARGTRRGRPPGDGGRLRGRRVAPGGPR